MKSIFITLYMLILGLLLVFLNVKYPQYTLINIGAFFYITNDIIKIFKL